MREIILIGDSIREGYQPLVQERLRGEAEVWGPSVNCYHSREILQHLREWVLERNGNVVHLNCGLHDIRRMRGAEEAAVPLPEYKQNVQRILRGILDGTEARLIWATTTPVNEKRHRETKSFDRLEADVASYNRAALEVCRALGVEVNDLCGAVEAAGRDTLLGPDGVHFTPEGYALLADAVACAVRRP